MGFRRNFLFPVSMLVAATLSCSPSPRYTMYPVGGGAGPSGGSTSGQSAALGARESSSSEAAKPRAGTTIRGLASFYADDFHGKKTSNGEIYDMHGLTCAHKTLPFNTWLEVRNLANNRTVIVRVNDRGPFVPGRVIDLSLGAAEALEMVGTGVQEVEIVVLR